MYKKAYELIEKYDLIFIYGHIRPDGDCLGSQLGLKDIIQNTFLKKEVYCLGESPSFLSFLGSCDNVDNNIHNKKHLAICVDCANSDKLSDQRFKEANDILMLDHHQPTTPYGTVNIIDTSLSSCSELIYLFSKECNMKITHHASLCLYTGLYFDSGSFKYDRVGAKTFSIASELCNLGVKPSYVDNILSKESLNVFKFKGYIVSNLQTYKNVCYVILYKEALKKYDISEEDASSLLNYIRNIDGFDIYFFLIEQENGYRVRLRSMEKRIDLIANKYRGGGHMLACGATLNDICELKDLLEDLASL